MKLPGKYLLLKCGNLLGEHVVLMHSSMYGLGMDWNWCLGARKKLQGSWYLGVSAVVVTRGPL